MDTAISGKKVRITKKNLLAFVVSFAFSMSPLTAGVYPFGISLLIASAKERTFLLYGHLLSIALTGSSKLLPACLALFIFFAARAYEKEKPCPLHLKLIFAIVSSILHGAKIIIDGITVFPEALMLISTIISIPLFTFLFSVCLDKRNGVFSKPVIDYFRLAFALPITKFFGLFIIAGVPLSLFAGALITLIISKTKGFLLGGLFGFVCGIACNVPAIAALGILGITYGLLVPNSPVAASILSFMLSLSGYAYLSDFAPVFVPGGMLLAAILVFIPVSKLLSNMETGFTQSVLPLSRDIKLKKLASAFSALSGVFFTISDSAAVSSITKTSRSIRKNVEMYCDRCKGCKLDRNDFCNHLTTEMRCKGMVSSENLPLHIKQGCAHAEQIIRSVNKLAVMKDEECEKGLRTMAEEYYAFSSLLNTAAKKQEDNIVEDRQLAKEIKNVLFQNKITCDRVRVVGMRQKVVEVFGIKPDKMEISSNRLTAILSDAARIKLSMPEFIINDDYVILRMTTLPKLHIEYAKTTLAKNGEPVCGDTVSFFENEDKYFYSLISDGMGSGRDASLTSRLSAIMLEKLLTIGAEKKVALQMVNKMLTQKNEEVFATIDLLEVDRITAQATLFKVGAAPTFLVRGNECHRIEAKTPPAGIMKEVIAEKISITLRKGDYIIMVSDGVVQTDTEFFDIVPLIKSGCCKSAHTMAARILEEARNCAGYSDDISEDDMSVCAMRFY